MQRNITIPVVALVAFVVFTGGFFIGRHSITALPVQQTLQKLEVSENSTSYKFINPLLFCQDQNLDNQNLDAMQSSIETYVAQEKQNGDLIDAAFYFKDLNGGPWSLINPAFRTFPASLLKVPLAISIYKHAEANPGFLDTKVIFSGGPNTDQSEHFQAPQQIQANTTYQVKNLLDYMLADSDNSAMYLLGSMISPQELADSYTRLSIEPPTSAGYTVGVKTYSSFFTILFSGTYLSANDSESLLSILSKSTFTQGIVAGVPGGTMVAHKFGEADTADGTMWLTDCGIVYKPNQPYLICVMTHGSSPATLANVISTISGTVYAALQSKAN